MQTMNDEKSGLMHGGAWLFLFLFTATCTFFFFYSLIPGSLWWIPIVAFVAFEYGVLHWLDYHKHGARNSDQWYCSFVMICASVGAVTIATGMELIRWFAQAGLIHLDLWWMSYGVWAVVAIFPMNLIALVYCELRSPAHLRRYQEVAKATKDAKPVASPATVQLAQVSTGGETAPPLASQNGATPKTKA